MPKTLYTSLLFILALASGGAARAQADTLVIMRRFLKICNGYKQLPVQLDVEVRNSSNLVLAKSDTLVERAGFYLCKEGSYIAMGGVEQLANDSLLLLVNKGTKRMILLANHQGVAARLKESMGMQMRDSTVDVLAAKYSASEKPAAGYAAGAPAKAGDAGSQAPGAGDTAVIELRSRAMLYHTQLPREQITMRYHAATNSPAEVTTIKRSLLPVTDSVYREASARTEWAGRTIAVGDSSFYLIKEQVTVFRYRKIAHEQANELPVRLSDRLVADGPGKYRPAASYADFILSRQF